MACWQRIRECLHHLQLRRIDDLQLGSRLESARIIVSGQSGRAAGASVPGERLTTIPEHDYDPLGKFDRINENLYGNVARLTHADFEHLASEHAAHG